MSSSACVEPGSQHHSTYATFRSINGNIKTSCSDLASVKLSSCVDYSVGQQQQQQQVASSNNNNSNNSRASSVVSAIIRSSSSFMSAEEEAHRMLRVNASSANSQQDLIVVSAARTSAAIISSPAEHQQRLVPAMTPSVPVPASFSEHLLSLEHDSLLMTSGASSSSSSSGDYVDSSTKNSNANSQPAATAHLVQTQQQQQQQQQNQFAENQSQRSLSTSTGYHSSGSSTSASAVNLRSGIRSIGSDDASPPPSSASSASSSSGVAESSTTNHQQQQQQIITNQDFFNNNNQNRIPSSTSSTSLHAANNNGNATAFVPRCSSVHTALAAIDEELPPLQANEVAQVDIFYRSLKTDVRVANGMAQMFVEESSSPAVRAANTDEGDQVACGIPLLLVDKFPSSSSTSSGPKPKSRRGGQSPSRVVLYLILAERGTGFTLKRERIAQRDCYTLVATSADTHRLTVVDSRGQKIVYLIKFASAASAGQFFAAYNELTRGDGIFASPSKSKSPSNGFSSWWKGKLPSKLSLSRPCCFRHLTNLDASYLALSQTAAIASPEHRPSAHSMAHSVAHSVVAESTASSQRAQTMPRRASSTSSVASSGLASTAPSNTMRPSSLSPLAAPLPCRVSMTPLATCPPVAPIG